MGSYVAFDGKRFIANITGIWSFAYKIHKKLLVKNCIYIRTLLKTGKFVSIFHKKSISSEL